MTPAAFSPYGGNRTSVWSSPAIATDDDGWKERLLPRLELEVALLLHAQLGAPVG